MNKYPNPEAEEKSGHPILTTLLIIVAALIVGYLLFGDKIIAAMIAAENNTKQPVGITTNADSSDIGNIDNPAGETFECNLAFLDMDRRNLATLKLNPIPTNPTNHPTTPDIDKFQANTQ